ncbi:MAG: hypothetical protein ACJ75Z_00805 [Solirubrobacterales bacterium]
MPASGGVLLLALIRPFVLALLLVIDVACWLISLLTGTVISGLVVGL